MTAKREHSPHIKSVRENAKTLTGASPSNAKTWKEIKWDQVEVEVKRLQMRIAKATQEKRFGKVKALQWLLTHSYNAKRLAVKRVTANKGAKTPGVDGVIWSTSKQKLEAINDLYRRGYRAEPLRRIYIPKKNGKQRPLGIPTMKDRAMQALYLLSLEPVAEITADPNSYGFRTERSTQDAMEQCFCALSRKVCAEWILEADIKSCFDQISHDWLLSNVVIDRQVLQQWLKAGYLEKQRLFSTKEGTPQGGIISPTLANIALNGIEKIVKAKFVKSQKVNLIRYADDFVATGATPEILEQVKSIVTSFLAERGLELSKEKTRITSIHQGFDFLGFNFRKYNQILLIKPAKDSIKKVRATIREVTIEEDPPLVGSHAEDIGAQVDIAIAHELERVRALVGGELVDLLHPADGSEGALDLGLLRRLTATLVACGARRLLNGNDVPYAPALRANVVERPVGHDSTAGNDDGARARGFDFREIVRGEHDRALLADLLQVVEKLGLLVGVEIARGLVENENGRVVNEGLRETDPLPIAVRELSYFSTENLREAAHFDDALRPLAKRVGIEVA